LDGPDVTPAANMILEGIVTTVSPQGEVNIAPMGPDVTGAWDRFTLRPFKTSKTFLNLRATGQGVLHVTDDVLLLAQAAIGTVDPQPELVPAEHVRGFVLRDCCRYFEFRIVSLDERQERTRMEAEVVYAGHVRDFFGFNRAKHAVVEAAILATRTHLLPRDEIDRDFAKLAVIVQKTGGDQELKAFELLQRFVASQPGRSE
jgi:hypothetical protein